MNDFFIELVSLAENPNFVIPKDGKYLVRRETCTDKTVNGVYRSVNYFDCRVTKHFDEKKKVWRNTFDCHGLVTHVSPEPLK